jgi:hypothetical protein
VTLPPADVLATYTRLRETQRALNLTLTNALSKKAILESAERLGLVRRGRVIADSQLDLDLVMDTAVYDYYPSGNENAVARYAGRHELTGDAKTVLDAMLRARFTLVELGERVKGVGVQARDVVFAESFFLADVALSRTGVPGLVLATRLLSFESFRMTTGAYRLFDADLASLAATSCGPLAGLAATLTPRDSSFLARLFLTLGNLGGEEARIALAGLAAAKLAAQDPRRKAYARLRAARGLDERFPKDLIPSRCHFRGP